jgi:hypothetical protein
MLIIEARGSPGNNVQDVIRDAISLATRIIVTVKITCNGVTMYIKPGTPFDEVWSAYKMAIGL